MAEGPQFGKTNSTVYHAVHARREMAGRRLYRWLICNPVTSEVLLLFYPTSPVAQTYDVGGPVSISETGEGFAAAGVIRKFRGTL